MNILYHMPTKVIMGNHCVKNNGTVLTAMGKKALIVTGARSAKMNGSLEDVTVTLSSNGQSFAVYDKVMSNPTVECAYEGAALARAEKADFVIAIGGGSPMDAAKAIALLAVQDISAEKLFAGSYGNEVLPLVLIPTTAGTGSEVTQYSILTNNAARTKTSIATPLLFPKIAFLDARYTEGLSHKTTVNTAIDALSHSVEGMLSNRANAMTDILASDSIRGIASCFAGLKKGELAAEQRERLLYASMLGGMVIANTGTTAVHAMGYSLTYYKDIDHGRANGLLLAAFLKLLEKEIPARVQEILALADCTSVAEFDSQMDQLLGEKEEMTMEEVELYTRTAMKTRNIANCLVVPKAEELEEVYRRSLRIV